MTKLKFIYVPIIILLVLTGCKSRQPDIQPEVSPTTPTATPPKHFINATYDCSVNGMKASGLMRMEEDSVIWTSVSLFVELGRARLTPDSVVGYVKFLNKYFAGTYEELYQRTGYRTNFATLQQTFLNTFKQEKKHVVIPIRCRIINCDAVIDFKKVTNVNQLSFPMAIPKGAGRL